MADDFFRRNGMENMRKIEELIQEGKNGNSEAYKIAYKKIIKQIGYQPKNPKFKSQLVKLFMLMENYKEAKKYAEQFSKEYPLDPVFILQRMDAYVKMGNVQKAQKMGNWLLEQDLVDSKILYRINKLNKMIGSTERKKEIYQKLRQTIEKESENEKGRNNYYLRKKLYRRKKEIEKELLEIDLNTLEGIDMQEQIEDAKSFLIGSIENEILEDKENVDNVGVLIDACMRVKNTEKALQIADELKKLEPTIGEEEKNKIKEIESKIANKKKRQNSVQPYYVKVIKDTNKIKPTEVTGILQKMNQLVGGSPIYKNIVMARIYDNLGWKASKEDEIKSAEKKVKTEHQKRVLSATIERMKEPVVGDNIGGDDERE